METMEAKKSSVNLQSKRTVIVLTVLGVVVMSALAWFFLIDRQLSRVGPGTELDLQSINAQVEQKNTYLQDLKDLNENYDQISEADIQLLTSILPGAKAEPELLSQIEIMARQSGVNLRRVNMSELEPEGVSARVRLQQDTAAKASAASTGVQELLLQVEVDAYDYKSFKSFMLALQNHSRIIDVQNFFFQTEQEKQTISAKTYYLEVRE